MENNSDMGHGPHNSIYPSVVDDTKVVALIDVDSFYLSLFEDFFDDEPAIINYFGVGAAFLEISPDLMATFDYIVINHNLFDMKGIDLLSRCRQFFKGKVCIISSFGSAVTPEEMIKFDISGDFEKQDRESLLDWYNDRVPELGREV